MPPDQVAENQRWRLIGAAAEVLAERGYARMTSKAIAQCAGVSSSAFYEHFEHLDACLLAAYEMAAECLWELVAAACIGAGEWPQRLRSAIDVAIEYVVSEPTHARLLGAEAPAGVAAIAAARERLYERLAGLLCGGRQLRIETAGELPPGIELHLVAGAFALASDRVAAGEIERLGSLASGLTEILTGPYVVEVR
jgi:AcrR family transcriptional regulator